MLFILSPIIYISRVVVIVVVVDIKNNKIRLLVRQNRHLTHWFSVLKKTKQKIYIVNALTLCYG